MVPCCLWTVASTHSPDKIHSDSVRAIRGSIVALVTPMHADGEIDYPAIDRLIEWHVSSGTTGVVAVGTTGESATLSVREHCELITHVASTIGGRIAVIAGTGANATREAIDLTRSASGCGADACLLVTPYYNKPTQEGLYQHYAAVAESVDIPQILYNVPSRTACDMEPATVIRLAELPNIVGIKEASGDASRVEHILRECPEGFSVYSGDDATAMAFMQVGASGVISVTANIAPKTMATVCTHALAGKHEHARAEDANLRTLHHDLFIEPNPIPVKWLMQEAGLIDSGIRLPLTPLSEPHRAVLRDTLHTTVLKDEIATYHAH